MIRAKLSKTRKMVVSIPPLSRMLTSHPIKMVVLLTTSRTQPLMIRTGLKAKPLSTMSTWAMLTRMKPSSANMPNGSSREMGASPSTYYLPMMIVRSHQHQWMMRHQTTSKPSTPSKVLMKVISSGQVVMRRLMWSNLIQA